MLKMMIDGFDDPQRRRNAVMGARVINVRSLGR